MAKGLSGKVRCRVLWPTPINVNAKPRQLNDEFDEEMTDEITTLVKHKYIEIVTGDSKKPASKEEVGEPATEVIL